MIFLAGFGLCFLCYLGFSLFVVARWRKNWAGVSLVLALGVTTVWALVGTLGLGSGWLSAGLLETFNGLRATAWLWFAYSLRLLLRNGGFDDQEAIRLKYQRDIIFWLGAALAGSKLLISVLLMFVTPALFLTLQPINAVLGLAIAVTGLVLVENIYQGSDEVGLLWALKHILIALGTLFAFDLFHYADSLLIHRLSTITLGAQPIVAVMILPLLAVGAVRVRHFAINIHVSRDVAVKTSALLASGVYLLFVAASGYLIRLMGWDWGPTLQFIFLVGAFLVLVVLLASHEIRGHGRHFIERSFFSLAYDYRKVWLRFVETIAGESDKQPLYERAIQAVADPLECSRGVLYLKNRAGKYRLSAHWNWPGVSPTASLAESLLQQIEANRRAIDLRDKSNEALMANSWLMTSSDPWLAVPLTNRRRLIAVVVLGKPRISRSLMWEDFDLLGILAAQVGGYIAEDQLTRALTEAQRFEQVSKNFSFVAHDLKNIVSELSLILQQAQKHARNPAFVDDSLLTVKESVEKMRTMLIRLRDEDAAGVKGQSDRKPIDLSELLQALPEKKRSSGRNLIFLATNECIIVHANPHQLWMVVENLLDNAFQAMSEPDQSVTLSLARRQDDAVIEIIDQGEGMSLEFIEEQLFRPFASSKEEGFGIGMYQCRAWVEQWGGELDVESEIGAGTTMRIVLPCRDAHSAVANKLSEKIADQAGI